MLPSFMMTVVNTTGKMHQVSNIEILDSLCIILDLHMHGSNIFFFYKIFSMNNRKGSQIFSVNYTLLTHRP